jgi:hypothetical protein
MTTPKVAHLTEEDLDNETLAAAQACLEWLHTAHFRSQGDYEYCDDAGLKHKIRGFLAMYASQVKVYLFNYELPTLLTSLSR